MKNIFKNPFSLVTIAVFFYVLIVSFIFQKYAFSLMPSSTTSLGLLKGDNELFHSLAIKMANEINLHGWSQWELFPMNFAAGINVGVLSAVYVLFGVNPVFILPINAFLQTLAFYILVKTFIRFESNKLKAIVAAIPFVVFPTALLWTSQVHKDSYAILAWFLILYAISMLNEESYLKVIVTGLLGFILLVLVRPLYLYLVSSIFALIVFVFVVLQLRLRRYKKGLICSFVLLLLSFATITGFKIINPINAEGTYNGPGNESDITKDEYYFVDAKECPQVNWQKSFLPAPIDNKLRVIVSLRSRLLCHQPAGTSSSIDKDYRPESLKDLIMYLPRALAVTLFYPSVAQLLEIKNVKSLILIPEVLIFYVCIPFTLLFIFRKKSLMLCLMVLLVLVTEVFLSYINPNMGTFHRIRYPFYTFLIGVGILGLFNFFQRKKNEEFK